MQKTKGALRELHLFAGGGGESSAESFSDIPPSVLSKLNLSPAKSSSKGNGTGSSRDFQSGMTSELSTELHGGVPWILWLADSLVRTLAPLDVARGFRVRDPAFGKKWRESSVRFDRASYSWKIALSWSDGDWTEYSQTWPQWGSMRNGECWARTMPERLTAGNESGFWRTPSATEGSGGGQDGAKKLSGGHTMRLRDQVLTPSLWPTPMAADGGKHSPAVRLKRGCHTLTSAVLNWPTPLASDAINGGPNSRGSKGDLRLSAAVHHYPTPDARDYRSPNLKPYSERGGGSKGEQLPNVIGGQLNPRWVEWLMGWPIGWASLKPLETDSFRQWFDSHTKPFQHKGASNE